MTKKLLLIALIFAGANMFAQSVGLSNFRIENSEKNRIYFDSSDPITTSSTDGFIVSKKTITGININGDSKVGHYFTVSTAFTYWDNNTIRYEGGSSLKVKGTKLDKFSLEHIKNNISIQEGTEKQIYVNSAVTRSGNGSSEATAFKTLQEGINALPKKGGGKIWVKAGTYRREILRNSSRSRARVTYPNVIEGYKSVPGDITSMYYSYDLANKNKPLDANEMPLFDGLNRASGLTFFDLKNDNYLIFRNIQIQNYRRGFRASTMKGFVGDNIVAKNMGSLDHNDGTAFNFQSATSASNFVRIKNSIIVNATAIGINISGDNGLIDNCKVYSNQAPAGPSDIEATTDYYYKIAGSHNIILNSLAYKDTPNGNGHNGHGFSLKTNNSRYGVEHNLIQYCTAIGIYGSFQVRHRGCRYNVFKDSEAHAKIPNRRGSGTVQATGGVQFLSGGSYNIFERLNIHDVDSGISFISNSEHDADVNTAFNSIIKNSTFHNIKVFIRASHSQTPGVASPYGNKIYNCTVENANYLFRIVRARPFIFGANNEFKNVILSNVAKKDAESSSSGWSYNYSNFFNSWGVITGNNNISEDPRFENSAIGDFRLREDSKLIDAGDRVDEVSVDYEKKQRKAGASHDIGAFEYKDGSTGFFNPSVGEDKMICAGEEVTLEASGGAEYEWDNGETTESITVSPTETTTYEVTISQGANISVEEVTISVNEIASVDLGDDRTICAGETITLVATGIGDFVWNTGETTESIEVSPTATATYSVTSSTSCGTEASDEMEVNVVEELSLDLSEDIAICAGETVQLIANSSVGNYLWNTGETTSEISVVPTETTVYSVETSNGSCNVIKEVTVTVNDTPSVDLGDDRTICAGETITLVATGSGDFLWNTGETTASIEVSPTATTIYSVTASTSCGTDAEDEVEVNVVGEISLDLSDNIIICRGETIELVANSSVANYLWSTGDTTSEISVAPTETTVYSVETSNGSCNLIKEVTVTVNEIALVDLGDDRSICAGETITLVATGTGDFVWNTGETTESIEVTPTATTSYSVISSTSCGTDAQDEIVVNVVEEVSLDLSDNITICSGETVQLVANSSVSNYLWNTGETTSEISVSPSETTEYSVESSNGPCSLVKKVIVTVNEIASVDLGEDRAICVGETITLVATGKGDFLWSTGETTKSIEVSPTTTTSYSVIASNSLCSVTAEDEVKISVVEKLVLDLSEDVTICSGETVQLLAKSSNTNYLWSTGETTPEITVAPTETTVYFIETSNGICNLTKEIIVTVNETANVDLGSDRTICSGETVTLLASGTGDFLWSTGETTESIEVSPFETTTYSVISSNSICSATAEDEIVVYISDPVSTNAGPDVTIDQGEEVTLTASKGDNYIWSTGETSRSITVSPSFTSIYTVVAEIDGSCAEQDEVIVNVIIPKPSLVTVMAGNTASICATGEVMIVAKEGDSYLWNDGETTQSITVQPTERTVYSVRVENNGKFELFHTIIEIDEDCNNSVSADFDIANTSSILLSKEIVLYPNPAKNIVNIELPEVAGKIKITLISSDGKIIRNNVRSKTNGITTQIDLSSVPRGVYFLRIYSNRINETKRLLLI